MRKLGVYFGTVGHDVVIAAGAEIVLQSEGVSEFMGNGTPTPAVDICFTPFPIYGPPRDHKHPEFGDLLP